MIVVALKGLLGRKLRAILTAVDRHVPLGHVPSIGNALTGRRSPWLASMTAVTRFTKSGAASGTRCGMWREAVGEPLPRMEPGDPADQIESFELKLVDRLWELANADNARDIADRTWDLVYDRPDDDPVKRRVVECVWCNF